MWRVEFGVWSCAKHRNQHKFFRKGVWGKPFFSKKGFPQRGLGRCPNIAEKKVDFRGGNFRGATEKCLTKGSKNGIIRMLCKAQRFLTPVKRGHSPKGGQSNGSYQFL